MNIILGDKTYVAKPAKARMFRQAIEINEKIDFNNLTTKGLDELIGFVCTIYGDPVSYTHLTLPTILLV